MGPILIKRTEPGSSATVVQFAVFPLPPAGDANWTSLALVLRPLNACDDARYLPSFTLLHAFSPSLGAVATGTASHSFLIRLATRLVATLL
ncbi:hypothetical protein LMH87_005241 [Akanthomyces muscarius]|uniref:Uncharacterized protein n=1 Tax=Akanthomyces muscarius TaxID=2231603 RepID=A0A9W8QND3_AKAMU|nr:hypothetical protein LMH87_005241 [Akanthomyces muscarius]KAJ4163519.1 hypothetical protein LMH87_005241 [Akanthomyces muscarius]